ncbi:MAG: glycoside hydrolase family 28 protein [Verrucomicrobiae bacterium]|nr:glycoside hydrolase family 28 protein [Verrucomicrobiae bacterium]
MLRLWNANALRATALACLVALGGCAVRPGAASKNTDDQHGKSGTSDLRPDVDRIIASIVQPRFPAATFDLTRYGAMGDGVTDCTVAFSNAIAACARAGGGTVTVPPGRYLTGPIHLRSNVRLDLAEGAEIVFKDAPEAYLPPVFVRVGGIELYNYSPLIYAHGCTNIAITGKGVLNGNATNWWAWRGRETREFFKMGAAGVPVEQRVFGTPQAAIRPSFVCFVNCTNVLLEDFTIGSGPNWTLHPVYCENVIVRRVTVRTYGPNNDGLDIDSCRNVLVEYSTFDTGDDCVVLKSGYNEDGWRVGRPTENVVVRHCTFQRGHGGIVIGSEMSGDVRNVFAYDCTFDGTDRAIRIKSARGRGGVVERIYARKMRAKNMKRELVILNMDYGSVTGPAPAGKPPVYKDMCFEDFSCEGAPTAILIRGLPDSPIRGIRFREFTISATAGITITHAAELVFERLRINCTTHPVFDLGEVHAVTIREVAPVRDVDVFLRIAGSNSRDVRVEACNLANVKTNLVTAEGASPEAVVFK